MPAAPIARGLRAALGALYGAGGRDGGAIAVVSNQELMLNLVAPAATDTWNLLEILTDPA